MDIKKFEKIAKKHKLGLQKVEGLETYVLYKTAENGRQWAKKFFRGAELMAENAVEVFTTECKKHSTVLAEPQERSTPLAYEGINPVEQYLRQRARRHPNGRFRGGGRGEGRRGR